MNGLDKTNYQEPIACSDAFVNFDCAGDILGKLDMMSVLELLRERPATPQEIIEAGWLLFAFAQFEAALILLADLPESPEARTGPRVLISA